MRSEQGYSLFELLVALGLIGILSAIAIPVMFESNRRNAVWTASELVGSEIRQARLRAISRNQTFRVRFNCPNADTFRVLVVTGVAATDNAVNRCAQTVALDSGIVAIPSGATFGAPPTLEVSGRGVFSAIGNVIPQTISVTNGASTRTLTVTVTGQITFSTY